MGTGVYEVEGRVAVVVGAARSGVAAAALLARRGARVVLSERRSRIEDAAALVEAGVALEVGGHRAATFAAADLVVMSPGVLVDQPLVAAARARGAEVIGELELASRWVRGPLVAITGTKGKSTTTTLVGRMFEAAGRDVLVGGNIGVPLSAQVEASTSETVHVIEASSFQLQTTTTFHPWIAAWLNFSEDHLDRHADAADYAAAKARLFAHQTADDWAVINADDPIVMAGTAGVPARRVRFGLGADAEVGVDAGWITRREGESREPLAPLAAVEMPGRHMLADAVAACAVGAVAGLPAEAMTEAFHGFTGLPHVMEPVAEVAGVRFVNDSKATNVDAARCAIESFERGVVAIVGGHYKGGDLGLLAAPLAQRGRGVVAIGEAAPRVRAALAATVPVVDAASMEAAVAEGFRLAGRGGVVLLAPACASFGWFEDYVERGEAFRDAVRRLQAREEAAERET